MEPISTIRRNVREIGKIEHELLKGRSKGERLGDFISRQAGSLWFVQFHIAWFLAWAVVNSGKIGIAPFDLFPYPFLTLVVSLEAIFLSLFILMSENRASKQADTRANLDLQINLLAEHESSKSLELLNALCEHHGLACANQPEILELIGPTKPAEILTALQKTLPNDSGNDAGKVTLT